MNTPQKIAVGSAGPARSAFQPRKVEFRKDGTLRLYTKPGETGYVDLQKDDADLAGLLKGHYQIVSQANQMWQPASALAIASGQSFAATGALA